MYSSAYEALVGWSLHRRHRTFLLSLLLVVCPCTRPSLSGMLPKPISLASLPIFSSGVHGQTVWLPFYCLWVHFLPAASTMCSQCLFSSSSRSSTCAVRGQRQCPTRHRDSGPSLGSRQHSRRSDHHVHDSSM